MCNSSNNRGIADLVGLRVGGDLPEHQAVLRGPRADQVQRRQAGAAVMRAAQRLAVNRDDLPGQQCANRLDPRAKAGLERRRLQQPEHAPEGIV
jgi:hypothetical protein